MTRSLAAVLLALMVEGCSPTPSATPAEATRSSDAATLTITGAGETCGPWWFGCGLYLVIEPTGWDEVDAWTPRPEDTQFAVGLIAGSDSPMRVSGVYRQGRNWVEPGDYRIVVLDYSVSDTETQRTRPAELLCSLETRIPKSSRSVAIDVQFVNTADPCRITVSSDAPSES